MKERLKELRRALDLSQAKFAQTIGLTQSGYKDYETGRMDVPRARVYQICKEFNVRREWLESGEGDMFEQDDKAARETEFLEGVLNLMTPEQRYIVYEALKSAEKKEEPEKPETYLRLVADAGKKDDPTA